MADLNLQRLIEDHVAEGIRQVNAQVDDHVKALFEEAFDAGMVLEHFSQTGEFSLTGPSPVDFETWWAAFKKRAEIAAGADRRG